MDVLANMGIESFKLGAWLLALAVGVIAFLFSQRDSRIEYLSAAVKGVLAATISMVAASIGIVFYVLSHATDARWSIGRDSTIQSPQIPGNPFFGQVIDTLNSFMGSVTGSVNDLFAIKNAFLSTQDFFLLAGWALLAILPLFILLRILNWRKEVWQKKQVKQDAETLKRVSRELEEVKEYLGMTTPESE